MTLNTDSRIRMWGAETNLQVDLLEGEALFDRKPNSKRSLTVCANPIELTDLGAIDDRRRRSHDRDGTHPKHLARGNPTPVLLASPPAIRLCSPRRPRRSFP